MITVRVFQLSLVPHLLNLYLAEQKVSPKLALLQLLKNARTCKMLVLVISQDPLQPPNRKYENLPKAWRVALLPTPLSACRGIPLVSRLRRRASHLQHFACVPLRAVVAMSSFPEAGELLLSAAAAMPC